MAQKTDPAGEGGAVTVQLGGERSDNTAKPTKKQESRARRIPIPMPNVPVHLLAVKGADAPFAYVEYHDDGRVFAGIEHRPWGWPDTRREMLGRGPNTGQAYANSLAMQLVAAALAEKDRRDKLAGSKWRERNVVPQDWGRA